MPFINTDFFHSGAPARRRSTSGIPYPRKSCNPLISKILVVTWSSVRPHAKPNTLKYESSTINKGTALILEIHLMINWPVKTRLPLTNITWAYHRLRFRNHQEVAYFLKLTADWLLLFGWIAGSGQGKLCGSMREYVQRPILSSN